MWVYKGQCRFEKYQRAEMRLEVRTLQPLFQSSGVDVKCVVDVQVGI
jgi:hypothetical protein